MQNEFQKIVHFPVTKYPETDAEKPNLNDGNFNTKQLIRRNLHAKHKN